MVNNYIDINGELPMHYWRSHDQLPNEVGKLK